ncbi:MAG TPA: hypothetical protein VIK06_06345 [Candidatus Limnocylindrales bacterium]
MSALPPDGLPPAATPWNAAHPTPAWTPPATRPAFDRSRLAPTLAVAAIVAGVVLGGMGLDRAIAEPSAGTVSLGGTIEMDAAPGWVLAPADAGGSGGWIELRKSDGLLYATVTDQSYRGEAAAILAAQESELRSETAQISFGDEQDVTVGANPTVMAVFEAVVSDSSQSATVDGELVAMVVDGNAVALEVFISQGEFGSISDDVVAMVSSVRTAP